MIFVFNSTVARLFNSLGIVIWPFVFIAFTRDDTRPSLLKHEFVHVHQLRREGVVWFYLQYVCCLLCYFWKHGNISGGFVEENKWEEEAYSKENDPLTDAEVEESSWTGQRSDREYRKYQRTLKVDAKQALNVTTMKLRSR